MPSHHASALALQRPARLQLLRLTALLGAAFVQSACNLAPAKPEKTTVSIRWTDINFREELTDMYPCDVVGLEVATKGYAPQESVEVEVSSALTQRPSNSAVDHRRHRC
ncbi:hypothetical protein D3C72_1051520 [compost metagenome]